MILWLISGFVLWTAAFVAVIIGVGYLRAGIQLWRFRRSMRFLAEDDAREDDPALVIPKEKGTLEEEKARDARIWELFYRPGLSIAKLNASDRLRGKRGFGNPRWIERQEWRGWQKLATQGSEAARKKSLAYARREAERQLQRLALDDVPLWLELYEEKEHPDLKWRWAKDNLLGDTKTAALRMLEDLALRDDEVGAKALYELFAHYAHTPTRLLALKYAKRHLEHPQARMEPAIRTQLRAIFAPDVDRFMEIGSSWKITAAKDAKLVLRVRELDVRAKEKVWLDHPDAPLQQAKPGKVLWESEIVGKVPPFSSMQSKSLRLPDIEGPIHVALTAQFAKSALWTDCMGDEEMPIRQVEHRLWNTGMDAVLTLTETSVSAWVVDKKSKKPIPGVSVLFLRRDVSGNIESERSATDDLGLFIHAGKPTWQFGVLLERQNAQGRNEQLFLTNGRDIKTSRLPEPIRRFYVMLARPLYRPGEQVQGKLFARQKGHEGQSKRLAANQTYQLEVHTPRGVKLTTIACTLSQFGTAAFDFRLPADAALGKYVFKVAHSYVALEGFFYVEEFVAPEFRAGLRTKETPSWGAPCKLEFEAEYFFGGPVANATGTIDIKRTPWRYFRSGRGSLSKWFRSPKHIASIPFRTNDQGKANIDVSWKGPLDLFGHFDGCDFSYSATVRDASGKSCQANLHVSVPRLDVVVTATVVRALRVPGENLPLRLSWDPADPMDEKPLEVTIICRKGWSKKTFVQQTCRSASEIDVPVELPAGKWELTAHVKGQSSRIRTKRTFTMLGPELRQSSRGLVVCNDATDNQGRIRVALMGPTSYCENELLVWNRGARLGSQVITRSGPTAWLDLPFLGGTEEKVHIGWWYFDSRREDLEHDVALANIMPVDLSMEPPVRLELGFAAQNVRPGESTNLKATLSATQDRPSELTVTVVDEAIFALVTPPQNAITFFEQSPPRPEAFAAWSVKSTHAQAGRQAARHESHHLPHDQGMLEEMKGIDGFGMRGGFDIPVQAMAAPSAAPMMMVAPAAKSASPLRAAAAVAAAPVALVGAGAGLVAETFRRRSEGGAEPELAEQDAAGGSSGAAIALRNDFSSEAAWIPNARWVREASLTLPISLPDSLTTWKASALLVSLSHDHLLEAHAKVKTQKPLMIRLQVPRFFQERDVFALRAMIDARSDKQLSVNAKLEAKGLALSDNAERHETLDPNGQTRLEVKVTVPVCQSRQIVVRAQARATNVEDVSDAEERTVPYRPYGTLLRKTVCGIIDEGRTNVTFDLPARRLKELTALSVQLDRGPLDAVVTALLYLREYPYGCVEQTCSRVLPHLLYERIVQSNDPETTYRSPGVFMTPAVVEETLKRILSMQNEDGGFGWWSGGKSDLWMTAYVVFTFSLASRPDDENLGRARTFLTSHLLKRDHSDDSDAFAAFVLEWTGGFVSTRVIEVLESRWENLSLSEKAKLCWVLAAQGNDKAPQIFEEVREALVGPAKRFLKKVARDDDGDSTWYHPGGTEAIAFFVLALLRERQDDVPDAKIKRKRLSMDDATLGVLISFLLQHRKGSRWHNTRDSALAVFALLKYEDALRSLGNERTVDVLVNETKKGSVKLERLGAEPVRMQFADEDLQSGSNEIAFVSDDAAGGAPMTFRHFTADIEYYTQEDDIAASGEGLHIERSYWLLDEKKEPQKKLRKGDRIAIGRYVRVVLQVKAAKSRRYLLLEDFKLAGCEPVAKKSGRDVCRGDCAHVELRADRTAIFFDWLGTDMHEVSYDIEAILPGRFAAMPARIETMYEARCFATSASFVLEVVEE